jgi:hypothetical protein
VPIYEGDRVRTPMGQEGTVALISGRGTLAYVRLDDDPIGVDLSLYESHALIKLDAVHPAADQVQNQSSAH